MFSVTQTPSIQLAFPDVCKTPTPAGPIPIPYADIGLSATATPNLPDILLVCMPSHNIMTKNMLSNGNQPGVVGGIISGRIMADVQHVIGSSVLFKGGMPTAKMLGLTIQNSFNAPGSTLSPSQVKELSLR